MPIWLIIQLGLLLIWLILAFIYYYSKGWRVGFPLKREQVFNFLFLRIVPIIWMTTSLMYGIFYIFVNSSRIDDKAQIFSMIVVPIVVLLIIGFDTWKRDKKVAETKRKELLGIKEKSEICNLWIKQFEFLSKENVDLKVYIAEGKPVGKLTVFNITRSQHEILQHNKEKLPSDIYLDVISVNESNDNNFIH